MCHLVSIDMRKRASQSFIPRRLSRHIMPHSTKTPGQSRSLMGRRYGMDGCNTYIMRDGRLMATSRLLEEHDGVNTPRKQLAPDFPVLNQL